MSDREQKKGPAAETNLSPFMRSEGSHSTTGFKSTTVNRSW